MATNITIKQIFTIALTFFVLAANAGSTFLSDKDKQIALLQKELNHYYDIKAKGGWGKLTLDRKYYMRGQSAAFIKQVKERLRASGDYKSSDNSTLFTEDLAAVIKRVQRQFGLTVTGSIDINVVKALNVTVDKRIAQLLSNIDRLKSAKISYSGTQLVANIPEYKLHVYEDGREVFEMPIVVGKESTKTVVFNGNISQIVFSPYWNVPSSIVANEILPAMRRDKSYLRNNGYEIVGREGGLPAIRQKPGANNSLGKVKFVFPNSHNIYLHDTPAKSIFKMDNRAYSHGCIRVAEPAKLAAYLLRNNSSWTEEKIRKAMDAGSPQGVKLSNSVPVAITYFTAWVDEDGVMNFRDDIYDRDKVSGKELSGVAMKD